MEFSGEQFIPGIENDESELTVEHLQRYYSILDLVKEKIVLDIASGEGYGCSLIAQHAKSVVGMDINKECIHEASIKYLPNYHNISFVEADLVSIPAADNTFDVVVSFETIEHVNAEKQITFLNEIVRVLKKDGILIISTPNKDNYSDRYNYTNKYHVKEFSSDNFINFIKKFFNFTSVYTQGFSIIGTITKSDDTLAKPRYLKVVDWGKQKEKQSKYSIIIASNNSINVKDISSAVLKTDKDYFALIDRVLSLQEEVENLGKWGKTLEFELTTKDPNYSAILKEYEVQKEILNSLKENQDKIQANFKTTLKEIEEIDYLREDIKNVALLNKKEKEKNELLQLQNKELETRITALKKTETLHQTTIQQLKETLVKQEETRQNERQGLNKIIEEKNAFIDTITIENKQQKELSNTLSVQITKLSVQIQAMTESIDKVNKKLEKAYKEIEELKDNLYLQSTTIGTLHQQKIADQSKRINFEEILQAKNTAIDNISSELKYKTKEIEEIKRSLDIIYTSDGWRLLSKYYKFKGKYLPENSKTYNLFRRIYRLMSKKKNTISVIAEKELEQLNKYELIEPEKEAIDHNHFKKLVFPKCINPAVSIIIPMYNGWETNYNCLNAILNNTVSIEYEVIVADDNSTDQTKNLNAFTENIRIIRNKKNLQFTLNCNNAAKQAKGKYLHFLNNDTEVRVGWLNHLVTLLERDERIGMAGSKLIYPNGKMQEAGGILWKDGSAWNYGNNQDPELPEFNYVKEVDYISGASIIIRKWIWDKLKGFDEIYQPAYCEDSDIAFEIRKLGYKVMYQPLSEITHFEGFSNGKEILKDGTNSTALEYQNRNKKKFMGKWREVLAKQHFDNGENIFWARDRSSNRKTIVVIDHYVPQWDKDAGSRTTFHMLSVFVELGYNVKFLGDNFYRHEPYTEQLQQMGIEVLYGVWYRDNWQQWIIQNRKMLDFFYVNRPHITIKYIDFLKMNTDAKIFYYGHDLHFLREQRQYEIDKKKETLESSLYWKKVEYDLFTQSDAIFSVSYEEKKIIQQDFPAKKIHLIPCFCYDIKAKPITNFDQRENILFVGGFSHTPNVDGLLWFHKLVWPKVKAKNKKLKLIIVGSNATPEILQLNSEDIVVKGFLSDDALNEVYENIKLCIIPLRFGAGVKGKTVEAIYRGIPLVSTKTGIEGMEGIADIIPACDTAETFANGILELYKNETQLGIESKKLTEYANAHFLKEAVKKTVLNAFN